MNKTVLAALVCPECKAKLNYDKAAQELHCTVCRLAYPIKDDIPVMLVEQARTLATE